MLEAGYRTQPNVKVPGTGGRVGGVQRSQHGDLTCPFDFEVCILRGLPSQFVFSILGTSALETPQAMEKMDPNETSILAPSPLPLALYIGPSPDPGLPALPLLSDLTISGHPSVPLFSPQATQIMNGLFHIALGSLLMIHVEVYTPICVTVWYPLWGGIMVSKNSQPFGE